MNKILQAFGRLVCGVTKHKRGRLLPFDAMKHDVGYATYQCPRCGATWTRKERKKVETAST